MKLGIAFCRLDARDDYYTGYSPVAFFDADADGPLGDMPNKETGALAILLQREYLTRLNQLQEELRDKYLTLAAGIDPAAATPVASDDEAWSNGMTQAEYEAADLSAQEQFPGDEAEYYT